MFRKLLTSVVTFLQLFFLPESQLSSSQRWVLGLVNLSAVIIFWVLSSFLVNDLFETNIYRKPFFITYINTSCFVFYLIPYLRYKELSLRNFVELVRADYHALKYSRLPSRDAESRSMHEYGSSRDVSLLDLCELSGTASEDENAVVGVYETVLLALKFIVLWFSANLVTNSSLSYTSVASQTILLSTSSFFTLIFGYLYSIEKINTNKVCGILLSFGGVLIVTKIDADSDPQQEKSSPLVVLGGNALALMGALIYGAYTILLKHKISSPTLQKERILDTHLFFGFVGLYCFVFFWPLLIALHYLGLEAFELPSQSHVILLLSVNAFITFISDFCWCKAVLLTSPLTVTVGLSLTIPLAMLGDWLFKGFHVNFWYLTGAVIVTLGFLVINKDEREDFAADSE